MAISKTTLAVLLASLGGTSAVPTAPSCLEISKAGPQLAISQQFVTIENFALEKPNIQLLFYGKSRADDVLSWCEVGPIEQGQPLKGPCFARVTPDAPFFERPTGDFALDKETGKFELTLSWACKDESGKDTVFTGTAKTVLPAHGKDGWTCTQKGPGGTQVIQSCRLTNPEVSFEAVAAGQ